MLYEDDPQAEIDEAPLLPRRDLHCLAMAMLASNDNEQAVDASAAL